MGFTHFYRHFIPHYSDITIPLTRLTRKGSTWDFSDKCCSAFNMLKKAFTTTPVLMHWIPGSLLIIKMDTSDYALATILSMVSLMDNEVHPITFHSHTFTPPKLNYNAHDKELLIIFEAFKIWHHYLEGSLTLIDVVMDHKNLEYFSTTKLLTHCQVHWLEFLCQFNLIIHFCPSCLGTKPNVLRDNGMSIHPKEGGSDYASVNLHNLHPISMQEQLASSLCTTFLSVLALCATIITDIKKLRSDICSSLHSDLTASTQLDSPSPCWSINPEGFLLLSDKIYIPNTSDL